MSLLAVALVLVSVAIFGLTREADEGTTAHLWQILVVAQLPIVAYFATKWRCDRAASSVLAVQALAFLAALAPVYFLHL